MIQNEGIAVFREQPGFIRYRLMKADARTTVAVAEWESEEAGRPGTMNYRAWLKESGISDKLTLETLDGPVIASS
jgi:heme-degrading monooxygenase HmoA